MKKTYIGFAGLGLLLLLGTQQVHAQQGFGTDKPHKSAAVDIQSSKRGLLIPRVDLVETTNGTTPINKPEKSLMVYNQVTNAKGTATEVTPGYYYWDGAKWVRFAQQGDISAIELDGDVTGPTNATIVGAIQGVAVSSTTPVANQVLTFIPGTEGKPGQWVPTSITPDVITDAKGITGTGITVGGGTGATLKDVTLAIAHGGKNQVMVTNSEGTGTTWVDQSTIAPATTHTIVKDATTGNTLTSTVNEVEATVNLVDKVTNTVTGTKIQTTVNGVVSESVDLKDAIHAGQKTTSVVAKDNKVTVTAAAGEENDTVYTVGVDQANFDLAKIGGSLNPGQIAPGTEGQVLTTVKKGDDLSTSWEAPKPHENIYTHDGTLVHATGTTRTVDFGSLINMTFKKGTQRHVFTYDSDHTGINMFGDKTSSIGLISKNKSNNIQSKLKLKHDNELSEIIANSDKGLRIGTEHLKNIDFTTYDWATGSAVEKKIMTLKGDGGVQVVNINEPEFKGAATDKVVVADATGVLKTVTATMPKVFYMPPVMFNTSAVGTGKTRNIYNEYVAMYGGTGTVVDTPITGTRPGLVKNADAENPTIPTFGVKELDFYVSYYDPEVFANVSVTNEGVLKYDIKKKAKYGSFMTIVFVVRDTPRP
ncbi:MULTISPECIES: hypothetical protein [unclassified Myroides]|uniref:hypothetical protein n=1 Tax=unclassified Myroides TaxID=2642485 RepID=UPI003D2F842B